LLDIYCHFIARVQLILSLKSFLDQHASTQCEIGSIFTFKALANSFEVTQSSELHCSKQLPACDFTGEWKPPDFRFICASFKGRFASVYFGDFAGLAFDNSYVTYLAQIESRL